MQFSELLPQLDLCSILRKRNAVAISYGKPDEPRVKRHLPSFAVSDRTPEHRLAR